VEGGVVERPRGLSFEEPRSDTAFDLLCAGLEVGFDDNGDTTLTT
jgi:hypothetical protein